MALLTTTGAKLVALILNALHGMMLFYEQDYADLNVDGLFGLRVIEGQLKHIWIDSGSAGGGVPPTVVDDIRNLSIVAGRLANRALPHVFSSDPKYFNQFKYLVHKPFDIFHSHRLTDDKLLWSDSIRSQVDPKAFGGEREVDKCLEELLQAVGSQEEKLTNNVQEVDENAISLKLKKQALANNDDGHQICKVTAHCVDKMLGTKGLTRYLITHQILYAAIGELASCTSTLNDFLKTNKGYQNGISQFLMEWCTNLLDEMKTLYLQNLSNDQNSTVHDKDLFMEMVFTCGEFGFVEFVNREWLESVLSWQDPIGCFASAKTSDKSKSAEKAEKVSRKNLENRLPQSRKLMFDKVLADQCSSHTSAVGAAALVIFLRFLLDPGPKEWSHLHIAFQRPSRKSIPLQGKFRIYPDLRSWAALSDPTAPVGLWEELQGPPPSMNFIRDPTILAFGFLILVFVFFTRRLLCKARRVPALYPFSFKKL